MPVDRSVIHTKLRISPDVLNNPESFIAKFSLPVRSVRHAPARGSGGAHCLVLDVLTYKGIKVTLQKIPSSRLMAAIIEFNPGVCLHGHNGSILRYNGFSDALSLLIDALLPLLEDCNGPTNLVPGLDPESPAYWSYLEISFQCLDLNGELLKSFRNLRHPLIRTPSRHWKSSITAGSKRSKLQICIYRKDLEMIKRHKLTQENISGFGNILRFEIRIKNNMLVRLLGNAQNTTIIDNKERLIRFCAEDLIAVHSSILNDLKGVYPHDTDSEIPPPSGQLQKQGRLIAEISTDERVSQSLDQILSCIQHNTGASSATINKLRKNALNHLSTKSSLSAGDAFSKLYYPSQPDFTIEDIEDKICHPHPYPENQLTINRNYRLLGKPFRPQTLSPTYFINS